MQSEESGPSTRRAFFFWILGGVGLVLGSAAGWAGLRYLAPGGGKDSEGKVELAVADVPVGGVKFIDFRGRPAVVLQQRPGEFVALSAVCTHLGCIVKWAAAEEIFICPCHAGKFSPQGAVLGGPPPKPLEVLPVQRTADRLVIG